MPRGVPVATVAINNSTNAALLAVRILGGDVYLNKLEEYQKTAERQVMAKIEKMQSVGWDSYSF